jgi:methionyl-tRNA formyltransferase
MKIAFLLGSALRIETCIKVLKENYEVVAIGIPENQEKEMIEQRLQEREVEYQVTSKNDVLDFVCENNADLVISVGWQHIVSAETLNYPGALFLNVHPALLPQYRGPNPWANIILNGEVEAGITIHVMHEDVDAGPIVYQKMIDVSPFDTYLSLRDKLLKLEPNVLLEALKCVDRSSDLLKQDDERAKYYQKRTPADSEIDPSNSLLDLFDEIRACDPNRFPAFFYYRGEKVCISLWRQDRSANEHQDSI